MYPACRLERLTGKQSLIAMLLGGTMLAGLIVSTSAAQTTATASLPEGSWRFIVSGDSRNCGDIVMPAIAAHSARFAPNFYWHLGDLRAIYKIDEDMAFAAANNGQVLACDNYERLAWSDFVENQVAPFGAVAFYVGIGNHEVMPPKNETGFKRQFADWLDQSTLRHQREVDKEPPLPTTYYHWIQGGVDFIYLDNSSDSFPDEQLQWLRRRLASAKSDAAVKSLVVGMHEALPYSVSRDHSMGDKKEEPDSLASGQTAYQALVAFRNENSKPVYVLASHSHLFMENIFATAELTANGAKPLPGWIVGTAGAVRRKLPDNAPPGSKTDLYGYLLGTVSVDGTIQFSFEEIHASDVPQYVWQRYPGKAVLWCFEHNSQNKEPNAPDLTPRCTSY